MSVSVPVLPAPVAPDPTVDFVPVFADQTEDVILGRMSDWANEGLDPVADADSWVDTREGGHWHMAVMPGVREIARLYDLAGTEVPMAGFVLWAWGTYLDDLAAAEGIDRLPATPSVGTLQFSNSGVADQVINEGSTFSTVPASADDPTPDFAVTVSGSVPAGGTLDLPIQATEGGRAGDVAAGAITVPSTPVPTGITFTNPAAMSGGSDVESDEALRSRVLQAGVGEGGANVSAYVKWAASWPGVGAVKVVPTPFGPNSVLVMVTDANGQPLPGAIVSGLQADLDPVAGKGAGTAPVGAQVTVTTSTVLNVAVAGTVAYKTGYSADGVGNTIAVRPDIENAIEAYLLTLRPGDTIRVSHVAGIIATWPGVENATAVQVNGGTADIVLSTSPAQAPDLTTPIAI